MFDELNDLGFVVLAVALDAPPAAAPAVRTAATAAALALAAGTLWGLTTLVIRASTVESLS